MTSLRSVFHFFAVGINVFTLWYDQAFVDIPPLQHPSDMVFFKGRLKFLTFWNMILQAVFFTICVLNDVVGSNEETPKKPPLIRRIKDLILACLAFPLSMFVGLTFWAIYLVDRELIFPKALDAFFPMWLNHAMHTNIMLFILMEFFTSCRRYPSRKFGLTVLSVFMLIYLIWIHIIHSYSGVWVYPILDVLNFPARIVFFIGLFGLTLSLYVFGEKLNGVVWGRKLYTKKAR